MKKLRVELEVDTSKAKKKVRQDLDASAAESGGTGGVSTASPALDRTTRQVRNLGEAANGAGINMKAAGKAFAGMAVGLAASYAAKKMPEGRGRAAVEYGSGAMQGASMGMMFGPLGAALGAAGGLAKTYLDRDALQEAATKDFQKYDDSYQEGRLWDKEMRELTDVEPAAVGLSKEKDLQDQLEKTEAKIVSAREKTDKLFEEENRIVEQVRDAPKQGKTEAAADLEEQLKLTRARREQVEGIQRAYEKQKKTIEREQAEREANKKRERTSVGAEDALGKSGAGWASPDKGGSYDAVSQEGEGKAKARGEGSSAGGGYSGVYASSVPTRKVAEYRFDKSTDGEGASRAVKDTAAKSDSLRQRIIDLLAKIDSNTKGGETWQ